MSTADVICRLHLLGRLLDSRLHQDLAWRVARAMEVVKTPEMSRADVICLHSACSNDTMSPIWKVQMIRSGCEQLRQIKGFNLGIIYSSVLHMQDYTSTYHLICHSGYPVEISPPPQRQYYRLLTAISNLSMIFVNPQ